MLSQLTDSFNLILTFGILLLAGYVAGMIANFMKLPKVTGYIAAGVLLEPSFLGILPEKFISHSDIISNFALCVISYAIGGSLKYSSIKRTGKSLITMTLFESMTTFLFVTAGLYGALVLFGHLTDIGIDHRYFLPLSLIAGALASPTDPTPTLAVKEEYKAEGPVTTTILGIGAFDDALGIINFSIGLAVCAALLGTSGGSALQVLGEPFLQIFFSLLNGAIFGGLLVLAGRRVKDRGVLVVLILGTLFSCYGTAQLFGLDELLSIMVTGAVAANSGAESDRFFISIRDYFEELVFVVFFVIAGSHLELSVLAQSFWVILVFAAARICGKFGGAYTGAVLSGAPPAVRKYSAFGLVPQGGIVVGLALLIKQKPELSPIAELLLNIILGTTVFFEFLGPLMTEYALKSTGETGRN